MSINNNMFFLNKIVDYWDGDSISQWSSILSEMSEDELSNAKEGLKNAVIEHTKPLSDELLKRVAYIMVDDLYKSANAIGVWNDYVCDYLDSTASVFLRELSNRGFSVHYLVDNVFDDMERPLTLFHAWYAACGIVYQCPQLFSKQNRVSLADARQMCQGVLKANNGRFHYILLDTDSEDDSFDVPVEQLNNSKIITVIRTEAAEPHSKVMVFVSGEQFQ